MSTHCRVLSYACLVLLLAAAPPPVQAQDETTAPSPRSPQTDTLRLAGTPGDYLIAQLPRQIRQRAVQRYEPLRLPALSLLVDHAFFWDTRVDDAGRHELQLRAHYRGAPSETVVVIVELAEGSDP